MHKVTLLSLVFTLLSLTFTPLSLTFNSKWQKTLSQRDVRDAALVSASGGVTC